MVEVSRWRGLGSAMVAKRKERAPLTCTGHLLGVLLRSIITGVAAAFRESVIRGLAVSRAEFAALRPCLVLEFTDRALGAFLLFDVSLVSRLAVASAARKVPLSVPFAEEGGLLDHHRVGHASADRLLDQRDLATRRRGREVGKVDGNLRTADVVDLDGKNGDAGALVPERKVDALLRHRYRLHLRVYHHLGVGVEPPLAGGDAPCESNGSFLSPSNGMAWPR